MAESMLKVHSGIDAQLGPAVLIRGRTTPFADRLRALGLIRRKRSGAVADGGPGHVVPADYVCPLSRWQHNELLRLAVAIIVAEANGTKSVREIVAMKQRLARMVQAKKEGQA